MTEGSPKRAIERLSAVGGIPGIRARREALIDLMRELPRQLTAKAWIDCLAAALAIEDQMARLQAIELLVDRLPYDHVAEVWRRACAIEGEQERAWALCGLIGHVPEDFLAGVRNDARAAARAMRNAIIRSNAFICLATRARDEFAVEDWRDALAAACAIQHEQMRATKLAALVPQLPKDVQPEGWRDALAAARAVRDKRVRALGLFELAPNLPDDLGAEAYLDAFDDAASIPDERLRASTLLKIVPRLPEYLRFEGWRKGLAAVLAIHDKHARACAFIELFPLLPADLKPKAARGTLAAARAIRSKWARARFLTKLAPDLPNALKPSAWLYALAAAGAIEDELARAEAFSEVVPHLPDNLKRKGSLSALAAVRSISDERAQARALSLLVPHFPEDLKVKAWRDALASARSNQESSRRSRAFLALTPKLPKELMEEAWLDALRSARSIANAQARALALREIAVLLPDNLTTEAWGEALNATGAIENEIVRVEAFTALAPDLPNDLKIEAWRRALAAARAIQDQGLRVKALAALAPDLPEDLQTDVWRDALAAARAAQDKGLQLESFKMRDSHLWHYVRLPEAAVLPKKVLSPMFHGPDRGLSSELLAEAMERERERHEEPAEVEKRFLNTPFRTADRASLIPDDEPLVAGRACFLEVSIGTEFKGYGEPGAAFPDRMLDDVWEEQETLPLVVAVGSQDFAVKPAWQTLDLPRKRASKPVFFEVTPPDVDAGSPPVKARIQVEAFHRGFLLQSKQVEAIVSAEEVQGSLCKHKEWVTFTTTEALRPDDVARLPERVVTIDVDRHPDTGTIQFRFLDRTRGDDQIALSTTNLTPAALGAASDGVRAMLKRMVTGAPDKPGTPEAKGYEWVLDGTAAMIDVWLPQIANAGRSLYRALLPEGTGVADADQGERLHAALVSETVIQVNPVLGQVTIPWALLYERPVRLIKGRTRCCSRYLNFAPECAGCAEADDPEVVCPNAFWGYRYIVEQLPCWTGGHMPDSPHRLGVVRNGGPLNLNFNVWRNFLLWRDHLPKLKMAAILNVLLAEDTGQLVSCWETRGSELDIVYFYSHGGRDAVMNLPYLEISDGPIDSNFLASTARDWAHNPLVFLNGCATGDYGPSSYLSLIEDFRKAGACGVVGTECPVPEPFAEAYAAALFPRLFHGESLGPAMLAVRRDFLRERMNPLGLVYTLYAASEVALRHAAETPAAIPTGDQP